MHKDEDEEVFKGIQPKVDMAINSEVEASDVLESPIKYQLRWREALTDGRIMRGLILAVDATC